MTNDDTNDDAETCEPEFDYGEVVQLKSGGPPMTIDKLPDAERGPYNNPDDYHCIWFKGASKEHGYFAEHLLKSYEPLQKK